VPLCELKFVLAFGEKQLVRAVEIRFGHEHVREAVQVAVFRRGGIDKFLRGGDVVFFQHHDEQLRFNDQTGEEKFHALNLTTDERR
jgi:hypothetical protein